MGQKRLQAVNTHSSREDFQTLLLSCHVPDAMDKAISIFCYYLCIETLEMHKLPCTIIDLEFEKKSFLLHKYLGQITNFKLALLYILFYYQER